MRDGADFHFVRCVNERGFNDDLRFAFAKAGVATAAMPKNMAFGCVVIVNQTPEFPK
jgi:hypothetical protein